MYWYVFIQFLFVHNNVDTLYFLVATVMRLRECLNTVWLFTFDSDVQPFLILPSDFEQNIFRTNTNPTTVNKTRKFFSDSERNVLDGKLSLDGTFFEKLLKILFVFQLWSKKENVEFQIDLLLPLWVAYSHVR